MQTEAWQLSVFGVDIYIPKKSFLLYPQKFIFRGGLAGGLSAKILSFQLLLQFQPDTLDTWHKCCSVVVDVQDAIFFHISLVISELWPLEFVKMQLCIDFRGLNSMDLQIICNVRKYFILFKNFWRALYVIQSICNH